LLRDARLPRFEAVLVWKLDRWWIWPVGVIENGAGLEARCPSAKHLVVSSSAPLLGEGMVWFGSGRPAPG